MNYHERLDNLPPGLPQKLIDVLDRADRAIYFVELLFYFKEILTPKLQKLMLKQYPDMQGHRHPIFIEYCDDIHNSIAYDMYCFALHADEDMRLNTNIREKYTYFDEIKAAYGSPEKPDFITQADRESHSFFTDEEFEKMMVEDNREIEQMHNRQQERMKQVYDIVQPVLFESCPWLMNMDADFWIIYAMTIRDAYLIWSSECIRVEEILHFGLPYEYINKNYSEYMDELIAKYHEEGETDFCYL